MGGVHSGDWAVTVLLRGKSKQASEIKENKQLAAHLDALNAAYWQIRGPVARAALLSYLLEEITKYRKD